MNVGKFARELGNEVGEVVVAAVAITVLLMVLLGLGIGIQFLAASQGIYSQSIPGAVLLGGLLLILAGIMVRNAWERASGE